MTKKDVLELKRRLKKDKCTFTKMCGCYVDINKNKVLTFSETFLNLEEEELFKYLDIAKKTLSGTVGNNILELKFEQSEETSEGKRGLFMALKDSGLKNDDILNMFYDVIIDTYETEKNYLILLFKDAYDVITKTTDNNALDESETVFDYILCAICPVDVTKAGLSYIESENRIGARFRDKIVGMPDTGFIFPAFSDRSTDIHSVMYYTKNPKDPKPDFMVSALGCNEEKTSTQQKNMLKDIVSHALGGDDEETEDIFMEIQESINAVVEENTNIYNKEEITLTADNIADIVCDIDIPKETAEKIENIYRAEFGDKAPLAENLIDSKTLALAEKRRNEKALQNQVVNLTKKLEEIRTEEKENSLVIKTAHKKDVKTDVINGIKYVMIPIEENETISINGETKEI
ncbi:hypothetical protein B5E58_10020 [Tyzzerella sp. An114]|uniref:DUF4317 domain-containing protein n=1 Tax=Tyzzerella sp. An114 TaxID=1965545 RepID=UPI000B43B062|nr:DUF4317 domain-containing protein [Tyzzerella sp. An114]OUQ56981.1 hypothetical protein B5E58_10020 [Tyzzerella sp. An114]